MNIYVYIISIAETPTAPTTLKISNNYKTKPQYTSRKMVATANGYKPP